MGTGQQSIQHEPAGQFEATRFEKIHNVIFDDSKEGSLQVAREISDLIRDRASKGLQCVLGLATGSSPIKVYEELVRMHREEGLSFKNVVTFNLDEYHPMEKANIQSYHYFMHQHLFDHVDIPAENVHIPDGTIPSYAVQEYCRAYEREIEKAGGLDFQLLGIGRTGHIGFNEPGSHFNSATRDITLDHITRVDAAGSFKGLENVPRKAITMGIGTIRKAKRIVLMAWGQNKSEIVKETVEGEISSEVPATYLQEHPNTTFVLDKEAAQNLTRIDTPWLVQSCDWTKDLTHKAVVWLSQRKGKPILQLTDKDYNDNGMSDLLSTEESSYEINIRTFNRLQHTITGWPGGKPGSDDSNRPERAEPAKKRVVIFSPHPDDDVISMGGTFDRLVSQGHEVHIVYQTSGNIAVADHEVLKVAEVANSIQPTAYFEQVIQDLGNKTDMDFDSEAVRKVKGSIRRSESYGATRYMGIPDSQVHFLDLPFYETGTIKKNPLGEQDIQIMNDIIEKIKPHQIYAAGDLADPHGTHRVCLEALFASLDVLKSKPFMEECWVWLYRGAWHEWDTHEIEMAVPMSPEQVLRKRKAIFFHQTQKDGVMFQGEDLREFWVRAEDRNKETAQRYQSLGLASYAAMEAFVRYDFYKK
ncbi:glucosamine-6-phosphate deaminase [Flagellimonas taeanensis]|uniref:Glucosamine-6-phosphate deaminase n=1 Tax=Flagellimonas taeanensis TaxID=1005926 RepID=A0A1M7CN11_9FLAO|nr:glucosamine-6-phosphate deaminase [Allomuricauda taeanensis]SFC64122.1 glucosamine-6-phosphate deaminase [Allomuricauda taeanensis]SHL68562.1 glucosamine-6-phosphate deaminase [Allomuricauda taeanensis]